MTGLYIFLALASVLFAVVARSEGVLIKAHSWRGVSLANAEPDLFHWVAVVGFVTIYVCKRCLVEAYRKLRCTMVQAVSDATTRSNGNR